MRAGTPPTPVSTTTGTDAWLYAGPGARGRGLEIIAIQVAQSGAGAPHLLVIPVMPTEFRG